jgi:signal transduction histidine kinase
VEDGRVVVAVTNEGGGISAVDIPYVFDYKVVGRYARETGRGAGIALIICKDFVERMGGVISVRSDGTNFTTFEYML